MVIEIELADHVEENIDKMSHSMYRSLGRVNSPCVSMGGHLIRMEDTRIPKQIFHGELQSGKRSRGASKKRFKDTLKTSLECFDIDLTNWICKFSNETLSAQLLAMVQLPMRQSVSIMQS